MVTTESWVPLQYQQPCNVFPTGLELYHDNSQPWKRYRPRSPDQPRRQSSIPTGGHLQTWVHSETFWGSNGIWAATSPRSQLGWTKCFPEHAETCKFTTVFVSAVFGSREGTLKEQKDQENRIKFRKHANHTCVWASTAPFPIKAVQYKNLQFLAWSRNSGPWCERGAPVERPINSVERLIKSVVQPWNDQSIPTPKSTSKLRNFTQKCSYGILILIAALDPVSMQVKARFPGQNIKCNRATMFLFLDIVFSPLVLIARLKKVVWWILPLSHLQWAGKTHRLKRQRSQSQSRKPCSRPPQERSDAPKKISLMRKQEGSIQFASLGWDRLSSFKSRFFQHNFGTT